MDEDEEIQAPPDPNVYQPDQEEDDELEIDRRIRRASERIRRLTIVGAPDDSDDFESCDTTVAGAWDTGYEVNKTCVSKSAAPVPPPICGCECPRDITEISGFTISFSVEYTGVDCASGGCSDTQTWTRIPFGDAFSAPNQFKLYLDNCESNEGCGQIFYEDNRSFSPIGIDCFDAGSGVHASFVFGSAGPPNFGGCCSFFTISPTDVQITLDFFAEGDNLCGNCVSELGDTVVIGGVCDMSALLGSYSVHNECADMFGGSWVVDGLLTWF